MKIGYPNTMNKPADLTIEVGSIGKISPLKQRKVLPDPKTTKMSIARRMKKEGEITGEEFQTYKKVGAAAGYGNMDEAKSTAKLDKTLAKKGYKRSPLNKTAAWTRKEGKDPKGGLNAKGVASYKRDNPGSKLQTAVTTKPSELKKGSKAAKRRKSFCARMGGMPGAMMKDGKPTRKKLALDKWNC